MFVKHVFHDFSLSLWRFWKKTSDFPPQIDAWGDIFDSNVDFWITRKMNRSKQDRTYRARIFGPHFSPSLHDLLSSWPPPDNIFHRFGTHFERLFKICPRSCWDVWEWHHRFYKRFSPLCKNDKPTDQQTNELTNKPTNQRINKPTTQQANKPINPQHTYKPGPSGMRASFCFVLA